MDTRKLITIAGRANRTIDSALQAFLEELNALVARASARTLARLQRKLELGADDRLQGTAGNAATLRLAGRIFQSEMERAGYPELVDAFVGSFGRLFPFFEETLEALGLEAVKFSREDREALAGQQANLAEAIRGVVRSVAEAAKRRAAFSVGGTPIAELTELLAVEYGKTAAQAGGLADTAITTFYRAIQDRGFQRIEEANGAAVRYRYYGPDDVLTRPFCDELLERTARRGLTRAEIDRLDNGQLPNVFLTGGGYRCRHTWVLDTRAEEQPQAWPSEFPGGFAVVGEIDVPAGVLEAFGVEPQARELALTEERSGHIMSDRHRELQTLGSFVLEAAMRPDEVYRNRKDPQVGIFLKRMSDRRWMRVVVRWRQPGEDASYRSSILSARVGKEQERAVSRRVWVR
ncbi:MAG: hypothetical protein K2X35_09620 [Bryobacteraceae bacterium]|nr:hypothetical protein [Bryobacteraceae bacterium]